MSRTFWFTIGVHSNYQQRRDIVQGFFRTLSCEPRAITQDRFSLLCSYKLYDNSCVQNIISQSKVYVKIHKLASEKSANDIIDIPIYILILYDFYKQKIYPICTL